MSLETTTKNTTSRRGVVLLRQRRLALGTVALGLAILLVQLNQPRNDNSANSTGFESRPKEGGVIQLPEKASQNNNKPYIILHVGPHKTATTTLQQELTKMIDILAKDNYTYAGKFHHSQVRSEHGYTGHLPILWSLKKRGCQTQVKQARIEYQSSSSKGSSGSRRDALAEVGCWKKFTKQLDYFQSLGHSVIISDENVGLKDDTHISIGRSPLDWIALQETLGDDWNLLVAVTYRRYVDWLPSAKQQRERFRPQRHDLRVWPSSSLQDGNRSVGTRMAAMFPDFWESQPYILMPFHFTDKILRMYDGHVPPVKVINLHDPEYAGSVTRNFVCTVLPHAVDSCPYSRSLPPAVLNPSDPPPYYDVLATTAADMGLLDTSRISRREAGDAAKEFQESDLQLSVYDFPLLCPSHEELALFLKKSLQLEQSILPEFAASPYGAREHERHFWETANTTSKYCFIDARGILEHDKNWIRFFRTLTRDGKV